MPNLRESISRLFSPIHPLPAGLYHYMSPPDDPRNYRLHLRLEADGSGILIVNASTILHLNQSAGEYAYYLVNNVHPDEAARKMASRYNVSQEQAQQDYENLIGRLQTLIETPDLDPVTFLDFERTTPFGSNISAPFRLDCALTYRMQEGSAPDAAPNERVKSELGTAEWKQMIDKAWEIGIPHIIFTGGEPTLRDDLPDLMKKAEANNQVTGLLSDGLRLSDPAYLDQLLQAGLDHMMLVLQPELPASWQALETVLPADLFTAIHLTLKEANKDSADETLKRLADLGVGAVSLSAASPALADALQAAREQAADLGLDLVWNMPVPYSALNPVALEVSQSVEQPEGAGRAWLYIEPDGDVLPSQGINQPMGNFLTDPWEKIWK